MRIDTERLVLREFREADWPAILAYWSDPRYQRYYPPEANVERAVRDLVGRIVAAQAEEPRRTWQLAIVDRQGRLVGNAGVRVNDPVLAEGNIGYELSPEHWGRGYATEAARAMLDFGFRELSLHRVWAECVAENTGSAHVLEKLGMRQEARFREHEWFRDRWWDTLIYAILDYEWRSFLSGRT
ncbi:MAG TPA: GNAT family N-acetyltransferase [Thermomicrobiaceae bacterium]|nr:GNAT family N-acetyltransferase [Thermomicrobiaceae bacterium]